MFSIEDGTAREHNLAKSCIPMHVCTCMCVCACECDVFACLCVNACDVYLRAYICMGAAVSFHACSCM